MSNSFTYLEKTALIIKPSLPYKIAHHRFLLLKSGLIGGERWKGDIKNKTMEQQRHSHRDRGRRDRGIEECSWTKRNGFGWGSSVKKKKKKCVGEKSEGG